MAVLRQIQLRDGNGGRLVTYVKDRDDLKIGNSLTLADSEKPDKLWDIAWVSQVTRDSSKMPRGWNNNI